jgi:hypothetical protein
MKKAIFILLALLLNVFVFLHAQDTNVTEAPQKPSKEDFFHTWVTERVEGKNKISIEITFNETNFIHIQTLNNRNRGRTTQNFEILNWEEVVNTYTEIEEYPNGFKISSKETKNGAVSNFAMFINANKTKYLSVIDLGFHTQYDTYMKK